jgi:methionyl-tRNA formyltransferase
VGVRVVYLGNDRWSVPPLEALADDARIDPVLVLTRTPRPGRRGSEPVPTPVAAAARELELPLQEVPSVVRDAGLTALRSAAPDVLVVVAYGELLPPAVFRIASLGAVNLHLSLLPRWRGASPVQHALLAGDEMTGVTAMLLDEGLDTGPVLEQAATPIGPEDDAGRLGARLARIGAEVLVRSVVRLAAGEASPELQDDSLATLAPKLTADDRRLRWDRPAIEVVRRVRALSPRPGAGTVRSGSILKVLAASAGPGDPSADPGTVVAIDDAWFEVAAREGGVRVHEVASEGRARMDVASWLRGARLELLERLG